MYAKMYDSAANFYIILGYPGLHSNRLGILPHRNSLVAEVPDGMRYLRGWDTPEAAPSSGTASSDIEEKPEDLIPVMVLRAAQKPPKKGRLRSPPPLTASFPEKGRGECAQARAHSSSSSSPPSGVGTPHSNFCPDSEAQAMT